ncbi:MAG: response regulator [Candidatus Competibacteraceae bacterium]|nr:response regulator [Candidatus Competibacteraceae bacterium]MCB1806965.1 response regulator [Candidatus Competibacteraceae bacterium]MCB1811184.1 response regulator [Candidatus Competibacteraceae bacterium]
MKTILIVDDMAMNRDLLEQLLEDDYRVVSAANGEESIVMARRERPDLILMDLSLPLLDGWDASRLLKADPELAEIPIIALTAHVMRGDEEKARAAGCDGFLGKPIDEDQLFATIETYLGEMG